jgi:hypothetical protein
MKKVQFWSLNSGGSSLLVLELLFGLKQTSNSKNGLIWSLSQLSYAIIFHGWQKTQGNAAWEETRDDVNRQRKQVFVVQRFK